MVLPALAAAAIPLATRFAAGYAVGEAMQGDDAENEPGGQAVSLDNGHYIEFSERQFKDLLHDPLVVDAITGRANVVCSLCNQMAIVPDAQYEVIVQNWPNSTRARAFVRPANYAAMRDDAMYSTMLKAASSVPSDPRPSESNLSFTGPSSSSAGSYLEL